MTASSPAITLIAALGRNRVIGQGNRMPWHLRTDLQRFKALTLGKPVVMGRKTFQSIGKPLPGRESIVVTRDAQFPLPSGVFRAESFDEALEIGRGRAAALGSDAVIIGGGGEIYALAMPVADTLRLTHVEAEPAGDAFFPPVDPALFEEVGREAHPAGPQDDHAFAWVDYRRRSAADSAAR